MLEKRSKREDQAAAYLSLRCAHIVQYSSNNSGRAKPLQSKDVSYCQKFVAAVSDVWFDSLNFIRQLIRQTYINNLTLCTPPGSTLQNSTFCPHSVFMCFVWISEQTAIISLYSINWLVFITETECVYCAVRNGYLYTVQVNVIP